MSHRLSCFAIIVCWCHQYKIYIYISLFKAQICRHSLWNFRPQIFIVFYTPLYFPVVIIILVLMKTLHCTSLCFASTIVSSVPNCRDFWPWSTVVGLGKSTSIIVYLLVLFSRLFISYPRVLIEFRWSGSGL